MPISEPRIISAVTDPMPGPLPAPSARQPPRARRFAMGLMGTLRRLATRPEARSGLTSQVRDHRVGGAGSMTPAAPIQRWWVSYVLVSAVTIIALLAALDAVARILQPLAHLSLVVLFALGLAFILAPIAVRLERVFGRPAPAVLVTFFLALVILGGAIALVSAPLIRE